MKKIMFVCNGGIANYPGKIGDVLVSSAVAYFLRKRNYEIHFVTNEIMKEFLRKTHDFSVSSTKKTNDLEILDNKDLEIGKENDFIFILKQDGNKEGDFWEKQLLDYGVEKSKVYRIGKLDIFSENGKHITEQIISEVLLFLKEERWGEEIYPLLNIGKERKKEKIDYAIFPFAGDRRKWLTNEIILKIISRLKGKISIFGSTKEIEENKELKEEIKKFPNAQINADDILTVCWKIVNCKTVFCVDGGLMWSVIAGLNWLALKNKISEKEFPFFKVIIGKDISENYLPSSSVWRPLLIFKDKAEIINEKRELRLKDIKIEMIIKE